jgi:cysteine desulfurase/selenocysteine lyase
MLPPATQFSQSAVADELISDAQRYADFPVLARRIDGNRIVYLDNAASSLKPRQVIAAITRYYEDNGANVHRGQHVLSELASVEYEEARYEVGRFIGAAGNEIAFTKNATESLNIVAHGLRLAPSDLILNTIDAHHSNYLPWLRSGNVKLVRTSAEGLVDLDHYAELLEQRPKLVALTHCSNVTGVYHDLRRMTMMAKESGALVVADLAQSISHQRVNVAELGIDFAAFSAHKMLGPTGIGVLYGKSERLDALEPTFLGGGVVDRVRVGGYALRKIPHRFEAGTPHIAGAFGLVAAIRYLERLGFDELAAHDALLGRALISRATQRSYMKVLGPGPRVGARAGMLSFQLEGVADLGTIARVLSDSYGIMCRSGAMCAQPFVDRSVEGPLLRVSCHLYNTLKDVEHLFAALDEIT